MHIEFVCTRSKDIPWNSLIRIRQTAGSVDSDVQIGFSLYGSRAVFHSQAMLGEHFVDAVFGDRINSILFDDIDRIGQQNRLFGIGYFLRGGIDQIISNGAHRFFPVPFIINRQFIDGNRIPIGFRSITVGDVNPQISALGVLGQQNAFILSGDL